MKKLQAEIAQKGYKVFRDKVEPRIERKLQAETARLLQQFDSHPVTQEINAGPGSANRSGTLGGYGNLFTFIGFERGSDPISPIRSLLARSIKIVTLRKKRNELALVLKFTVPTEEEIEAVSPLPWASSSWVTAVEKGMSGLGRYLYSRNSGRFQTSRSGQAIETTVEVRGAGSSTPTEYISGLLKVMLKNIENSLKTL